MKDTHSQGSGTTRARPARKHLPIILTGTTGRSAHPSSAPWSPTII